MKNRYIKFCMCFSLLMNLACDKDDVGDIVPTVVIFEINIRDEGGVELIADFQNFTEADELGFILSSNQGLREILIPNPTIGRNVIRISSGLYLNRKYDCFAYIKNEEDYIQSQSKSFFATSGSRVSSVESITPAIGFIGDLITINFSEPIENSSADYFNIKLDRTEVEIIEIIDNQKVVCRVPNFINPFQRFTWAALTMTYLDKVIPVTYEFNLKPPTISAINPQLIDWGEEVTISGEFFKEGYPADYVEITLNGMRMVDYTNVAHNEIRFNVSKFMFDTNPVMVLDSNGLQITETNTFAYHKPEIISVEQGTFGDEIEIIGKYFWPAEYVNEVYFDSYPAEIIRGESTRLLVVIPEGNYTNNQALLTIKTTDQVVSEPTVYVFQ